LPYSIKNIHGGLMKYLDKGMVYIQIDKDTTKEEMDTLKSKHQDKTIVFLRSGSEDIKKNLLNFIVPR
jgi:hypothetical protein